MTKKEKCERTVAETETEMEAETEAERTPRGGGEGEGGDAGRVVTRPYGNRRDRVGEDLG